MADVSNEMGKGSVCQGWKSFWMLAGGYFIRIKSQSHWGDYKTQFAGWQRKANKGCSSYPLGKARLVGFMRRDDGGNFTRLRLMVPNQRVAKEDRGNAAVFVLDASQDWKTELPKEIVIIGDENPTLKRLIRLTTHMKRRHMDFGPHAKLRSFED